MRLGALHHDQATGADAQRLAREVIAAAIEVAHEAGVRVAAHAVAKGMAMAGVRPPPHVQATVQRADAVHAATVRRAFEAGIAIVAGTDDGHGTQPQEGALRDVLLVILRGRVLLAHPDLVAAAYGALDDEAGDRQLPRTSVEEHRACPGRLAVCLKHP